MKPLSFSALFLLVLSCIIQSFYLIEAQTQQQFLYVDDCYSSSNYTSGSAYERNLNFTLNSLVANASQNGFYISIIVGQNPDTVYGLFQCFGDFSAETCRNCANIAAKDIRQRCPTKKEASIGYERCVIKYSNRNFFSTANSNLRYNFCNKNNATDPVLFYRQLVNLLNNLSSNAESAPAKYALGTTNNTDNDTYGLVQCTRELAEGSCLTCLREIISKIGICGGGKLGAQLYSTSCYLRYEIYRFVEAQPELQLSPPEVSTPPPPLLEPNSTAPGTTNTANPPGKKNTTRTIVIIVTTVAGLLMIATILTCLVWRTAKKKRPDGSVHEENNSVLEDDKSSTHSLVTGLRTIKAATGNFSDEFKLGQGGFGPVYKGILNDGREIAVKRLSSHSVQGVQELKTEVKLVAKLLHRNLVRLLGFCLEEKEKLLVYEYLPNGSLDKILFVEGKRHLLEWERRYKIIAGIARGLLYLHEESQLRVIHRDLKASNILLDENMNPKISDFGLAKLFQGSQTHGNTNRISGTFGYMAPEYVKNGNFSIKSDVYSFGVLVLEIITGRKNSSFRNLTNLQSHAWEHWSNGTTLKLMDPTMGDRWPKHEALKCIHMGLLCVQEATCDRPKMSEVVVMLNSSNMASSSMPSRPAFFISKEAFDSEIIAREDTVLDIRSNLSTSQGSNQSVNGLTITELYPRD
ncbi:hypothetical protein FNV43_RR13425 [Rhamnella rubrinervis]|uniref:Cysteine-rich receptor-like protein kinase 10 n=1 Tax=Rhamnella rubrinervis TaxID=2594499 RepID=A0A8K0MF66_9ROSA|nr:hypothetical protein FNV43_RR13425 [Rhamnella rubrinervis]